MRSMLNCLCLVIGLEPFDQNIKAHVLRGHDGEATDIRKRSLPLIKGGG